MMPCTQKDLQNIIASSAGGYHIIYKALNKYDKFEKDTLEYILAINSDSSWITFPYLRMMMKRGVSINSDIIIRLFYVKNFDRDALAMLAIQYNVHRELYTLSSIPKNFELDIRKQLDLYREYPNYNILN